MYSPGVVFSGTLTSYDIPLMSQPFLRLEIPPPPLSISAKHEPPPLVGELYPVVICVSGPANGGASKKTGDNVTIGGILEPRVSSVGYGEEKEIPYLSDTEVKNVVTVSAASGFNGKMENEIIKDVMVNIKWIGEGFLNIFYVSTGDRSLVHLDSSAPDVEKDFLIIPVTKNKDINIGDISLSALTNLPLILHSSFPISGNLVVTLSHSMVLTTVSSPFGEIGSPPVRYSLPPLYVFLGFVPAFIPTYRIFSPIPLLFS
jgi:hypothetical protein